MHEDIRQAGPGIELRYDSDLAPHQHTATCTATDERVSRDLERIEVDPRGGLTMSYKAVGRHAHAFRWDARQETVIYEPHAEDDLTQHIPDVVCRTT